MIEFIEYYDFNGISSDTFNVSGIESLDDFILLITDEVNNISVLKKNGHPNRYRFRGNIAFPSLDSERVQDNEEDEEIDLEDIARHKNTFYVIGSHSLARKRIKPSKKYKKNLERLETVSTAAKRNQIIKFTINVDENSYLLLEVESKSLIEILKNHPVLGIFTNIPSKENGVDIEAIAVDEEILYLGFRGPVLRSNYVPVMVTTFNDLENYQMRYVDLDGRGIRGMTKVEKGFLLIGGPMGNGTESYQLYFWDGTDCIPGKDREQVIKPQMLGQIPTPKGAKAEGIKVIKESASDYEFVIVYDGAPLGKPTLFHASK